MPLPATLVWENRPTDGTANAGGGFDPQVASAGTDYSQQNAVQVAFTDLVVGTPNTDVTSVANPFTAAHVGNNIAITTTGGGAAWSVGIYNIRSVAVGVARLDRSPAATASAAGVGNLGGARNGYSTGTTTLQASLVAGNTVYVKGSGQTWNEAVSLTVAGGTGTPIKHIGYNVARNDIATGSTTARPVNDRGGAAGDAFTGSNVGHIFYNFVAKSAGDAGFSFGTGLTVFVNCRATQCTGEGFENAGGGTNQLIGCESDQNAQGMSNVPSPDVYVSNIHNNSGRGIDTSGVGGRVIGSVISGNGGNGINCPGAMFSVIGCTVDGNTGASTDGIANSTPATGSIILNNIFSNNGRYGLNMPTAYGLVEDFNDFYLNGTAAINPARPAVDAPGPGTNDLFVNPVYGNRAAGDFSVGANLPAFPGIFPGATSTGYLRMGAVQPNPAGTPVGQCCM